MKLKVYTDGGSRWNPWCSGIWVYITDEMGQELEKRYKYLWVKTNNEAEYIGAYFWIQRAIEIGASEIELFMDSDLVIQQLSGKRKIKKAELKEIHTEIKKMINENNIKISFQWIRREQNKESDRLSNIAMDLWEEL